ncbi:MAG: DUF4411 family protein [Acidobacteria bacterium]|nr:DUF4411 family protein [Acidobacteriota bacterium]
MGYLLDANIFIRAKNEHYGFDFCPAFWDWVIEANAAGRVFSVEKVGDELQGQSDELSVWAAKLGDGFFLPPDEPLLPALAKVSDWVKAHGYEPAAIDTFFKKADYYLVAHALAHGHAVVTNEVPSGSLRKVKIPEPCIGLGVKCMAPHEMLRRERARFVLGPTP